MIIHNTTNRSGNKNIILYIIEILIIIHDYKLIEQKSFHFCGQTVVLCFIHLGYDQSLVQTKIFIPAETFKALQNTGSKAASSFIAMMPSHFLSCIQRITTLFMYNTIIISNKTNCHFLPSL